MNSILKGNETKCEICAIYKNTRLPYPKLKQIPSKDILQLVHSDIWGPSPDCSYAGH